MEWQPIETAPKDCLILAYIYNPLFEETYIDVIRWQVFEDGDGFWGTVDADEEVTHWIPLPKPPLC